MTVLMVKHWNIFHVFHLEIFVIIVINLNKNISPVNLMINIDLDSDSDLIPTGRYSTKNPLKIDYSDVKLKSAPQKG